jgi:hypothetical protein
MAYDMLIYVAKPGVLLVSIMVSYIWRSLHLV